MSVMMLMPEVAVYASQSAGIEGSTISSGVNSWNVLCGQPLQ